MKTDSHFTDELLVKLEPEWGSQKIESLKLIYQIGKDDEDKQESASPG